MFYLVMHLLLNYNKCLKVCDSFSKLNCMYCYAVDVLLQFWAEKAEKVFPNHDVVFHLKVSRRSHSILSEG